MLLKFATMLKDSPSLLNGNITVLNDPRILPVGYFLRKTKINELPQLFNVIFGDLSLVGPRPLTPDTFDYYSPGSQQIIHSVRPGLSGIGSIIFRDEENILQDIRDPKLFYRAYIAPYKEQLEIWFVNNKSFKLYLQIILLTVLKVIFKNNQFVWQMWDDLPRPTKELKMLDGSRL